MAKERQESAKPRFHPALFVKEAIAELKKVVHPTRQEAMQATMVTMLFMGFFAVVLALLDWILKAIIWQVL